MSDQINPLKLLEDTAQIEAIESKLNPNYHYFWRFVCRKYSKMFNTPYKEVLDMDPEHVFFTYYEEQLDSVDVEEKIEILYNTIKQIEDPNFDANEEKELEDFIKEAELEEEERLKNNKGISMVNNLNKPKNSLLENEAIPMPKNRTQGYVDLSYLGESDSER